MNEIIGGSVLLCGEYERFRMEPDRTELSVRWWILSGGARGQEARQRRARSCK